MSATTTEAKAKAGRRPIDDKKIPVTVYRPKSDIQKLGGAAQAREAINTLINNHLNNTNNV